MVQFHWRLPTHGDRADVALPKDTRGDWGALRPGNVAPAVNAPSPYHEHLLEIARAAEIAGFDGALIPSFPHTDDPWVVASSIARHTKTLRTMIEHHDRWIASRGQIGTRASFAGRDLRGADLSGVDLSGADFTSADLSGANLAGALLAMANFYLAVLDRAELSTADLSGADLTMADLSAANLTGVRVDETTRGIEDQQISPPAREEWLEYRIAA